MHINAEGLNIIKSCEGCRLTAYKDAVGVLTIGYGHTAGVKAGQTITQAQADAYLLQDITKFENHINKYAGKYGWNENQFSALVSFAFNIGSIDQLTANGTRSNDVIAAKMLEYTKAGGRVLNGLVTRRQKEHDLFLKGEVAPQPSGNEIIRLGQQHSINFTGYAISVDGVRGPETVKNQIRVLQQALNLDYNAGLDVDGIWGNKTSNALGKHYVKHEEKQYMVTAAEILCMMHGIDCNGVECPGVFGGGLERAANASKLTYDWFIMMARN